MFWRVNLFCWTTFLIHAYWYYPTYFYEPNPFLGEARLAKPWLTTIDIRLRGGHSLRGFDGIGCTTLYPLTIYGAQNMHMIAKGVPDYILRCCPNCYLNTLWQENSATSDFATLAFDGNVASVEFLPTFVQNFDYGFFAGLCVPIKRVFVRNLMPIDFTTPQNAGLLNLGSWHVFFSKLCCNLRRYGIDIHAVRNSGFSDIIMFGGWSINYENFTHLDFVDGTITLGAHIPVSPCTRACCPFLFPVGGNGHNGLSVCATGVLGALDWLTIGLNVGALKYFAQRHMYSLRTSPEQEGMIKLARDWADITPGLQWRIGEFFKFDHLIYGFSFTFGFSHTRQNRTCVAPVDTQLYNETIVNNDSQLLSWSMHVFHFVIECDFATFKHPTMPHLAFSIDHSFAGKRVTDATIFGAIIGFDF